MGLWRCKNHISRSTPFPLALILAGALIFSGCSEAALQGASGIADSVGSAVTGFETAGSQTRVNNAQVKLTLANAALVRNQVEDLELRRDQVATERPVVVEILRERSRQEHDPFLDEIALWVSAGGDPNYAFRYLMDHESARDGRMRHNTLVVPPEASQPRTSIPPAHRTATQPNSANAQTDSPIVQSNSTGVVRPNPSAQPKAGAVHPNTAYPNNVKQPASAFAATSGHPAAAATPP